MFLAYFILSIGFYFINNLFKGNSMSNHPIFLDFDIFTSQILFIFSLFVDNVEMINLWKFQPSTPYSSEVIEIWKLDRNGCSSVKFAILNFCFL